MNYRIGEQSGDQHGQLTWSRNPYDEDPNDARTSLGINRKMYSSDSSANGYVYQALSGIGDVAFMVTNKIPATMPPEIYGSPTDQ